MRDIISSDKSFSLRILSRATVGSALVRFSTYSFITQFLLVKIKGVTSDDGKTILIGHFEFPNINLIKFIDGSKPFRLLIG